MRKDATSKRAQSYRRIEQRVAVAVEYLRKGLDSPAAVARALRERGLVDADATPDAAKFAAVRALSTAREEGFQKIGPATIEDARGALDLYAAEMLETARLAKAAGAFSDTVTCMDRFMRAHGIRIDQDVQAIAVLFGRDSAQGRASLSASLERLFGQMDPKDATQLVMLASKLDSSQEETRPSEPWATGTSEQDESDLSGEILDVEALPDTESPDTASPDTDGSDSPPSETPGPGSSEDEI